MAEITFKKVGTKYEAEFEVNGNFALHIERSEAGVITMEQTSVKDSAYCPVVGFSQNWRNFPVIDTMIVGDVYPMYIKLVSETQPSKAVVTEA